MSLKIPDVLSFQRGTIVTDGLMSSITIDKEGNEKKLPIKVIRHGIRGVNSHAKKDNFSNIQQTESAKTHSNALGLAIDFSYKTIPAKDLLFSCSDQVFRDSLNKFIDQFFTRGNQEFEEVCRRYARNILNGRWLWRNRILGEMFISVEVGTRKFTSTGSRLNDFENYTDDEIGLANAIATGFLSNNYLMTPLKVEGRVLFGFTGDVEVFPSQNMVGNKPKGFARSLYKVDMPSRKELQSIMNSSTKGGADAGEFMADIIEMGRAAIRDQKIGNAIRTIDTWYSKFSGIPIPVEPNGANLEANQAFRDSKKLGDSANDIMRKMDSLVPTTEFQPEAAFLIAILIRGGVFSEKDKDK